MSYLERLIQLNLNRVTAGRNLSDDLNVIVEIPMHGEPIKYEVDKDTGAVFVDRFLSTAMHYPCNYGYIPHTLSENGDPVDVLVVTPVPLITGVVVRCRPIGMLKMSDEAGANAKLVAVPIPRQCPIYDHVQKSGDLPEMLLSQIEHFFMHYKDLEPGKWVSVKGWAGADEARTEILAGVSRYEAAARKLPC